MNDATTTNANQMETITLIELFQPQLLAEAESNRVNAEQIFKNVKPERATERAKMYDQHTKLGGEIRTMTINLRSLQECIQFKKQRGLDVGPEETQLAQTKALVAQKETELKELGDKFRPHDEMTEKLIAEATAALGVATRQEEEVRSRIGKAIIAHEGYQADPTVGVGPIPKFKTVKDAVAHFYKIGFSLTNEGEAWQAFVGDLIITYVKNGRIEGMLPAPLSWLGSLKGFQSLPCHPDRAHILDAKLTDEFHFSRQLGKATDHRMPRTTDRKILCFIESSGQILASHTARRIVMPGKAGTVDFSDLFGSWETAMTPFMKELEAIRQLDLQSAGQLPMLGELITEAWKQAAAVSAKSLFEAGQTRMSESQINELVGAYWRTFIASPWEPSTEGTYALLKHRCSRGETPNVFSFETKGHFGFRVRTPDHDWIKGEIYCPPENFHPEQTPDPMHLVNHAGGEDWLAELGPVKFVIRGKASRS